MIEIANMVLGGLAAGMVLFIVSVGLSVTMGLMGFVNLAHGGFAMIGGYVIVLAMNRLGIPFVPALALGFQGLWVVAVLPDATAMADCRSCFLTSAMTGFSALASSDICGLLRLMA